MASPSAVPPSVDERAFAVQLARSTLTSRGSWRPVLINAAGIVLAALVILIPGAVGSWLTDGSVLRLFGAVDILSFTDCHARDESFGREAHSDCQC